MVTRLRPPRAGPIGAQVAKLAQDLASNPEAADAPRQTLADLVQPLEDLDRFPALDAAEARAATELAGRDYTTASAAFTLRAGAGIDALAAGDASALKAALAARPLFAFIKHLAGSAAYRLDKVPVGNLVTFSVSEKVWSPW